MTIKELKTIIRKLDKNTIVKVNGKDSRVEISVKEFSVNSRRNYFVFLHFNYFTFVVSFVLWCLK